MEEWFSDIASDREICGRLTFAVSGTSSTENQLLKEINQKKLGIICQPSPFV